jgi:hypothetical protein
MDYTAQIDTLAELETRQEDLLKRLEDLDARVEKVLAEWLSTRNPEKA